MKGSKDKGAQPRLTVSPSMDHLNLSRVQSAGEFLAAADAEGTMLQKQPPMLPR